jgi:hypothetical protein
MRCLRKHIHRLDLSNMKAQLNQEREVTCEALRLTGDIDQDPWLHDGNGRQDLRITARTGRIDNNRTERPRQGKVFGQNRFDITGNKSAVADSIHFSVCLGMAHCFWDGLNAQHLMRFTGQVETDAADTTVKIEGRFTCLQVTPIANQEVDTCSLSMMDLKKGSRAQAQANITDLVDQVRRAKDLDCLATENHIA